LGNKTLRILKTGVFKHCKAISF